MLMLVPAKAGPYDPLWVESASSKRAAIEKALDEPADFDFAATPLSKVVDSLRTKYAIEVQLDTKALEEAGIAADTPVTCKLKFLALGSALQLVLRELDLTAVTRHNLLLITTTAAAEMMMDLVIYPVDDLILPPESVRQPGRRYQPDYDVLIEMLTGTIAPTKWGEGNNSPFLPFQGTLLVSQTQDVHAEIAEVLAELRAVRDVQFAPPDKAGQAPALTAAERRREAIREALRQPVDIEFIDKTLPDIVDAISKKHKIPVRIDHKALEEAGVETTARITRPPRGAALRDALDHLLHDLELTWVVSDGVLLFTTRAQAEVMPETRVYPIAGLGTPGRPAPHRQQTEEYDQVLERLTGLVEQTAWAEVGGIGSARIVPQAGALVASQTYEVQEKVEELLSALRKIRGPLRAGLPAADRAGPGADELVILTYPLPGGLGWHNEAVTRETPAGASTKSDAAQPAAPIATAIHSVPPTADEGERIAQQLAGAIVKFVEPKSWEGAGGQGTITVIGHQLLVRQRMAVHDQVADFLATFNGWGIGNRSMFYPGY